jgi:nitrogen-specific signal transduction histidine kinase
VSPNSDETFSFVDYKLLSSLAEFASMAMKHQGQEKMLRRQANEAGSAAKANEMAHHINNPLQSLTNTIYLAQQGGVETQAYLRKAREELAALSELVGKLLA